MSGIYIPGMEMPTSCIACHLNFGEKRPEYGLTIYCPYSDGVISWRDKAFDNGRLSSCGIVSVPEHRDLMDRDEFIAKLHLKRARCGPGFTANAITMCMNDARDMPTIIPADKEE